MSNSCIKLYTTSFPSNHKTCFLFCCSKASKLLFWTF